MIGFFFKFPGVQVLVILLISLATHIYTFKFHPFATTFQKLVDCFNETSIVLSVISLIYFSDFVLDPKLKYELGWFIVYLLYCVLALNIAFIIISAILNFLRNRRIKKLQEKRKKERLDNMKNQHNESNLTLIKEDSKGYQETE